MAQQCELSDGNFVNTVDQIQKTIKSSKKLTGTYPFTLSWSHYLVLMRIESEAELREWIEEQEES